MEGYIPMRDRQGFVKSDGWKAPQFWQIERGESGEWSEPARSGKGGPAGPATNGASAGGVVGVVTGPGAPLVNGAEGPGVIGSTPKTDVKGEEEWVETTETDGREADRIETQMVDIGQRPTFPTPSADPAVGTTAATTVAAGEPAPPPEDGKQTYGARDLLEMPPLDQIVSNPPSPLTFSQLRLKSAVSISQLPCLRQQYPFLTHLFDYPPLSCTDL